MTDLQRYIMLHLLNGGNITQVSGQYRLRDYSCHPLRKFSNSTMKRIKPFLRKDRKFPGLFVLDLRKVRSLRRNHYIKQQYTYRLKETRDGKNGLDAVTGNVHQAPADQLAPVATGPGPWRRDLSMKNQ